MPTEKAVCVNVYFVSMYVCMYVCIHIWSHMVDAFLLSCIFSLYVW